MYISDVQIWDLFYSFFLKITCIITLYNGSKFKECKLYFLGTVIQEEESLDTAFYQSLVSYRI